MSILSRITQIYRRKHLYERLRPNNREKTITWIKQDFAGKRKT